MSVKLMVVDDQAPVRDQVAAAFALEDELEYRVTTLSGAREALDLLERLPFHALPDVILLDRMMPEMSGDECLRVLKGRDRLRHIPVLLMTAKSSSEDLVEGLTRLGADSYIKKPFHLAEMIAHVKVLVRMKRAEDRQRQLEREKYLKALDNGLTQPLAVLMQVLDSLGAELHGLQEHSAVPARSLAEVVRPIQQVVHRMRRYLDLELGGAPPQGVQRHTLADLLRQSGLTAIPPEAGVAVRVNAKEIVQEVLQPILDETRQHGPGEPKVRIVHDGNELAGRVGIAIEFIAADIAPEGVKQLLHPFSTVAAAGGSWEAPGTLAIARSVLERYAGSLQVEPGAPQGATCTVWLPRDQDGISAGAGHPAQAAADPSKAESSVS